MDIHIEEAKKLLNQNKTYDIRPLLIRIAIYIGIAFAVWSYVEGLNDRIEFTEAACAELNVRIHEIEWARSHE